MANRLHTTHTANVRIALPQLPLTRTAITLFCLFLLRRSKTARGTCREDGRHLSEEKWQEHEA